MSPDTKTYYERIKVSEVPFIIESTTMHRESHDEFAVEKDE